MIRTAILLDKHSYVVKVKVKLGSIVAMKYEFHLPSVTRILR
jgi:hypothetical protein